MKSEIEILVRKDIVAGKRVCDICKKHGISRSAISRLKQRMQKGSEKKLEPKKAIRTDDPILRSDAIKYITKHKKGFTITDLAKKLDLSSSDAEKVVQHISHHDGYNLIHRGDVWSLVNILPPSKPLNLKVLLGNEFTFGVVSDNHLCSEYSRLDVLEAAYDLFAKEGVKHVFNAGNVIDGEFRFNMYELLAHGVHDQALYFADHYPQRSGITTHFVTGTCHEGWYQDREGLKIGWYIQKVCEDRGRKDIVHIGHVSQDILLKQELDCTRIRLMHPGGGTPYALSYPSQKMVESFQGGDKPHVLILGHYHKFDFNYQREVLCIMAGTTQDQSNFMMKNKLAAHVGFCKVTLGLRVDGTIGRSAVEWFPFYDKKYHKKLNEYELMSF
jgi:predicted phosphodiesterase